MNKWFHIKQSLRAWAAGTAEARIRAQLTQGQVAKNLGYAQGLISSIETGRIFEGSKTSESVLLKARAYGEAVGYPVPAEYADDTHALVVVPRTAAVPAGSLKEGKVTPVRTGRTGRTGRTRRTAAGKASSGLARALFDLVAEKKLGIEDALNLLSKA